MSAVVLAYGDQPWLDAAVRALLASEGVDVDVVIVDNGGAAGTVGAVAGVTVVGQGRNLGFAGGCNAGARQATGEVLAFVNGDVVVDRNALAHLVAALEDPSVAAAQASVRLGDEPERVNSWGNDLHFLGFSWSGGHGQTARPGPPHEVTVASGACFAMRRATWEALGGFAPEYFAYHEDVELSIRCWQRGWRVLSVPAAVAVHHYEFARNPGKLGLIERNRLLVVLTLFEGRTLALLAPALLAVEAAMMGLSAGQGWWREKVRGYRWLLTHRRFVRERRRRLQAERQVADAAIAARLVARIDPGNFPLPAAAAPLDVVLAAYWAVARRLLA